MVLFYAPLLIYMFFIDDQSDGLAKKEEDDSITFREVCHIISLIWIIGFTIYEVMQIIILKMKYDILYYLEW